MAIPDLHEGWLFACLMVAVAENWGFFEDLRDEMGIPVNMLNVSDAESRSKHFSGLIYRGSWKAKEKANRSLKRR